MENNELFKVIEHLKRTLSDISSARQQVNDTVAAYSKTQTKIDSYVEGLNGVEKEISRLVPLLMDINVQIEQQSNAAIDNLEEACSSLLTNAKKELTTTSEEFSEHTLSNIGAMTKQIDEFERVIERAGTFFNKIDTTSKEVANLVDSVKKLQQKLVSSQDAQDVEIGDIKKLQNKLNSQLMTVVEVQSGIVSALSNLESKLSKNGLDVQRLHDEVAKIETLQGTVLNAVNMCQGQLRSLKDDFVQVNLDMVKEMKINRYVGLIVLVGIIAMAIFMFVLK